MNSLRSRNIVVKIKFVDDFEDIAKLLNRYYQIKYARAANRRFSNVKLESIIGNIKFASPRVGLRKCSQNFLERDKMYISVSWKNSALFDRICREKTSLHEFSSPKERLKYLIGRYTPYFSIQQRLH